MADHGFFRPRWSDENFSEWTRNLQYRMEAKGNRTAKAAIDRIAEAMARTFPEAMVPKFPAHIEGLAGVPSDDLHVVCTAVACSADAIVTFNIRHFPQHELDALEIDVIHPDDFVMDSIDFEETRAVGAFKALLAGKRNPPWSIDELVTRVRNAGLPAVALWIEKPTVTELLSA